MKRKLMTLLVLGVLFLWPAASLAQTFGDYPEGKLAVKVWLNEANGSVYRQGSDVSIFFQATDDCYVALYNIDTQGFVNVLYPKYEDQIWVEGGRIYRIPDGYDEYDLVVDGPKGIEYVVAVASRYPLDIGALYADAEHVGDEVYYFSGRITGDPQQAIWDINEMLIWGDEAYSPEGYASDIGWFYVGREVPYPRYLVYEWYPERFWDPYWDPYVHAGFYIDFHWGHGWCNPWWWGYGHWHNHHYHHNYWYTDIHTGVRHHWKHKYYREKHKSDWYRDKPVKRIKKSRQQLYREKTRSFASKERVKITEKTKIRQVKGDRRSLSDRDARRQRAEEQHLKTRDARRPSKDARRSTGTRIRTDAREKQREAVRSERKSFSKRFRESVNKAFKRDRKDRKRGGDADRGKTQVKPTKKRQDPRAKAGRPSKSKSRGEKKQKESKPRKKR